MNTNTIRDIRQHLAGELPTGGFLGCSHRLIRKITTRFLLEHAVYVSGNPDFVPRFSSCFLREDHYDETFMLSGFNMFETREEYERCKDETYRSFRDLDWEPLFHVVDGKILRYLQGGMEEQYSIEEALDAIFPEVSKKVILFTGSPQSDGFVLDFTKPIEEVVEVLQSESNARFGVTWNYRFCENEVTAITTRLFEYKKAGKIFGKPYQTDGEIFYWEVMK